MSAHSTMKRGWRITQIAAMAAALVGAGACDPEPFGPQDSLPGRVEVVSSVTPPYVGVGERVFVTIDFVSTDVDDAQQRAHVSWDEAMFEYIQLLPPGSSPYRGQQLAPGSMSIEPDLTVRQPKTRIILVFQALANTSTRGISVYPDTPPPLR